MNKQEAEAQLADHLKETGQPSITIAEFIQGSLKRGKHPRWVRESLQVLGIRWNYTFSAYDQVEQRRGSFQGARERARRQRQFAICEKCDEPMQDRQPRVCDVCLSASWSL